MGKQPAYRKIMVRPMTSALGAEVEGVDLSKPIGKVTFDEILAAFHRHLVLVFRDQSVDAHTFAALATRFGPPILPLLVAPGREHPFVTDLVREAHVPSSVPNVGGLWHSDQSVRKEPSLGFILQCLEAPDYGGDTLFTSLYDAYESLSDAMKALCDRLTLIHSASVRFGRDGSGLGFKVTPEILELVLQETEHPLVRIHPATGRKLLFVNGVYTIRIGGMTDAESKPLLGYFNEHITRPEFTCRVRWRPGTLVIVDNRAAMHRALNDYAGSHRHMMRVEMAGDRPFGPAMPREALLRRAKLARARG
jgi:taurine dioxygenase